MNRFYLLSAAVFFGAGCFAQTGWVVVPIQEYENLHRKAYPQEPPPAQTPLEATLTRLEYDLRVDGLLATGRALLTIDVLKDGWVRVPIPPGLLVKEARLAGKSVPLVPVPGKPGQISAVLSKKGRSVLTLDVAFQVPLASGEERLTLPSAPAGVTRASVALVAPAQPTEELDLHVTGGFLIEKHSPHWLAYGRGNEPLVFTWRKKVEDKRVELPLRMRGSLTQYFALGEDSTALSAEVAIDVAQGLARQVKLAVPDTVTIHQVPGASVADWDAKNGVLEVNFLEPVEHETRFTITGESRLAREGAVTIPLLRLLDAERESGGVAVDVVGAGELKALKPQGLEAVDPGDLGATIASHPSPSLAAFRIRPAASTRSLSVEVARYAQQAVLTANAEEARYRVLFTGEGKTLVEARYAVRNNQRNFVKVTLPAGATLWSSSLGGRPVRPGQSPDGGLLFPLAKSAAGEDASLAAIQVLYAVRGEEWPLKGRAAVPLPAMDLPVSKSGVLVYYPPQFRVTPEPGAFQTQDYEAPSSSALSGTPLANDAAGPQKQATAKQLPGNASQQLVEKFNARSDPRKTAAALPVSISFPAVGPSVYLASQLTEEGRVPLLALAYQKDKKGGRK